MSLLTPKKQSPLVNWKPWHTLLVLAISMLFVLLTIYDWFTSLRSAWLFSMAVLVGLILIVGHGVTGVWKGAFVDDNLRVSLSRVQLLVWTAMIVAALGVIAIERAKHDPGTALSIQVPETVWALLGISAASFIGSPLIKKTRQHNPFDQRRIDTMMSASSQACANPLINKGPVAAHASFDHASLANMFMGDWVHNCNVLDVSKIQLFLFTGLLALAYGNAIAELLQSYERAAAAAALNGLPNIGGDLLPLLGISHAGYLMGKVATAPKVI